MNWFNLCNFWISYDIWSWFRTNYLLKISWVGKSCAMFIKKCMIRCWTEVCELVLETLSNKCMWQWHLRFDLGFSRWSIVCFHLIDVLIDQINIRSFIVCLAASSTKLIRVCLSLRRPWCRAHVNIYFGTQKNCSEIKTNSDTIILYKLYNMKYLEK